VLAWCELDLGNCTPILIAADAAMGGMDMSSGAAAADGSSTGTSGSGGSGMLMGGAGSGNMSDPCYSKPSDAACADFQRNNEEWEDDIAKLCGAMPFMTGCTFWVQCTEGSANGTYCEPSAIAGTLCVEMPGMKGCEAWNALCANNTAMTQCSSPGPVPGAPSSSLSKEGIESLCNTHCMDGCGDCEAGKDFNTCTDPLLILAHMCYAMGGMPECLTPPTGTGINDMCANEEVKATFPLVCVNPPSPAAKCP
jgi:copper transporter 1